MKTCIGVDPGLSGAIAAYDGSELLIWDIPTFIIERNRKNKRQLDVSSFQRTLTHATSLNEISAESEVFCYLESVNAMPGQGVTSMFSMGRTFGQIEASVIALDIPLTMVNSRKWKKEMSCPADKDGARLRASQLLPSFAHNWDLKKHDGRAEAALIALYGFRQGVPT